MQTIYFICTGNTCRSPMAQVLFDLHREEHDPWVAKSCGLYAMDGMPASEFAIQAAAELGADLSSHRSAAISADKVAEAAYLICMTAAQRDALCRQFPEAEEKALTLCSFDISDPFGAGLETYRKTAREIDQGVQTLLAQLKGRES